MTEQESTPVQRQVGERVKSHCVTCRQETHHVVVCSAHEEDYYPDVQDDEYCGGTVVKTDHQIVKCLGCHTLGFRRVAEEDQDGHISVAQFPPPSPDVEFLRENWRLPRDVYRIHRETLTALTHQCRTLAGVGIRLLIELVCKEEGVKGRNLAERIDALAEKGVIAKASARVLHLLRDLGNEAAHDAKAYPLEQLVLAMDIVQTMLKNVYLHPHQAAALARKVEVHKSTA